MLDADQRSCHTNCRLVTSGAAGKTFKCPTKDKTASVSMPQLITTWVLAWMLHWLFVLIAHFTETKWCIRTDKYHWSEGTFKVPGQPGYKMITGSINLTNYNATLAEITAITGKFKAAPRVILEGISSGGHLVTWVAASKAVKALVSTTGAEAATDVNVGTINFIAIGV